ncbi:MAG: proline--tRNA ligase [Phycisphaerales bacterium]|nr:MAG: proline--tRNA ligase [Phycisphaerales bacterium]
MLWTKYFIPTVKEVPAEATAASHQLMIRAGLIRQVAAGAYTYLPLGYRVLQNATAIIREEMNRAGAIELHMPAMHPIEWWEETGRVEAMGDTLVHLSDKPFRKGTVLGPTHEEVITEIARAYLKSHKHLPVAFYQIQTKFRDEARPKSGVLRTREFLMKDAYSFHADKVSLDRTYEEMYQAYCRIYQRCGLPYQVVEADSGPIGGDASHEFMVVCDAGEDQLVRAADGSSNASLERAAVGPVDDPGCDELQALQEVHTPGLSTIDQVSAFLKCRPEDMIKTLVYSADGACVVALVRGDHEVNEAKLRRYLGAKSLQLASAKEIEAVTGAAVGYAGPVGLKARIIADQAVTVMHNAVTGANKTDYHVIGVNPDRDFEMPESADIRYPTQADRSPSGAPLFFEKCIEVGHVFKLGTKYSAAMSATFANEAGEIKPMIMGCYGIGVNRIVAAAIEAFHDGAGIRWPMGIAPFKVIIVALDVRDEQVMQTASTLHDRLEKQGIEVLLDDRDARPGFKFKDADLIGIPIRLTVGRKSLADGVIEFKRRDADEVRKIKPDEAIAFVMDEVGRG